MSRWPNSLRKSTILLLAAAAGLYLTAAASAATEKPAKKAPQVEVVFCLDTTGSMGGLIEAAKVSGCTRRQILWRVQLPLALPEIMLGLNQVIMLALSMDIIAAMIGTRDLGQEVFVALSGDHGYDPGRGQLAQSVQNGGTDFRRPPANIDTAPGE